MNPQAGQGNTAPLHLTSSRVASMVADIAMSSRWWEDLVKITIVKICREYNIRFYVKKDLAKFNENIYLSENELNQDYLNV